jgi:dipeptidyl aminopeptidase/acylaminoacyl peptidase
MVIKGLFSEVILAAAVAGFAVAVARAADNDWESFPDGSTGQVTEFQGVGGVKIPAYVRKPAGSGPFPVIVMIHGGGRGEAATYGMGRSQQAPTEDFIKAGWAVYSIDYRPTTRMMEEIEIDDGVEAVKLVRTLPFVDPERLGILGGSHGGHLTSRLIARVDARGAVLNAPAALDLIEDKKAAERGENVVAILSKLAADMEKRLGGTSAEIEKDPARYGYSSPLTEAGQVRCPVLIVSGKNDPASPTSVVDLYVARLRAAGKQVETYMPENGPHGFYFGRPDIPEWKESARRAVAFFQKCFGEKPGAGSAERSENPQK